MSILGKCLRCCQPLDASDHEYHAACSNSLFGKPTPPDMPYALDELEALAENIVKSSVTIPGVQEKLSLHLEEAEHSAGKFTLVGLWGDYILKPPVRKYPEMPEIEALTMHLAALCGIRTVNYGLIRLKSGELAYITKRLDREANKKVYHMEDMCQLTEQLTEHKYRSSMEKVAKAIHAYSSHPLLDLTIFFDIALFCFIVGNADMHLKNFSLYYSDSDLVQLAPAYDLVATRLLIPEADDREEMALALNGKRARLKRRDFDTFAGTLGLNDKQTANAYARIASNIPSVLSFIEQSFISDEKKEAFEDLINLRCERLEVQAT